MSIALNEIYKIRKNMCLSIDKNNTNRYTIVVNETNGTKTAYCFSTPIYSEKTRRLLDFKFNATKTGIHSIGSNCDIYVQKDAIVMQNPHGKLSLASETLSGSIKQENGKLICGDVEITPTLNGVLFKTKRIETGFTISMQTDNEFLTPWENNKCFALMRDEFTPFVSLSAIGVSDSHGEICAPALVSSEKCSGNKYKVTIKPTASVGKYVFFEANLYEEKLFQDTTVESKNPLAHNAYGGIAFLGNSETFGEKWLYTRPDISKIPALTEKRVKRVRLLLPIHGRQNLMLNAHQVTLRFCSFGSSWENKVSYTQLSEISKAAGNYNIVDISKFLIQPQSNSLMQTDGIIIRPYQRGDGFCAVSTGDSYYRPQILEVNYS